MRRHWLCAHRCRDARRAVWTLPCAAMLKKEDIYPEALYRGSVTERPAYSFCMPIYIYAGCVLPLYDIMPISRETESLFVCLRGERRAAMRIIWCAELCKLGAPRCSRPSLL